MNRWRFLGLILLVLIAAAGCANANPCVPDAVPRVAVVSALEVELLPFLEQADTTACTHRGVRYHVGVLAGHDAVLYHSGVGLDNATKALTGTLERFELSGIVVSGIAGGINPRLDIGDVAVPSQWAQYDGAGIWYASDPEMLVLAQTAASELEEVPTVVLNGRGVSSARFVDDAELRSRIWNEFGADIVDMETSTIARIATEEGIPFIAFRSVSDLAGGGGGENEINVFRSLASGNSALCAVAFLESWEQSP